MIRKDSRNKRRIYRHNRIRSKIIGNKNESKFRLVVFRSNRNIEVQVVDDKNMITLVHVNSKNLKLKNNNIKTAEIIGKKVAEICKSKNINKVVFDRSGYIYHGRIKALADSARNNGLIF